jgi:hypothetical protein
VQSALDEPRPQQPSVVVTQTRPSGPQEHKERSALVQRPQQSCATEAQIGPNSQHKEQSALVQRPQQPRATVKAQLKAQPEQQSEPEPHRPEPQSMIEPQSGPEPGNPKPGEPEELRVVTTDAEPDHWKPGGFEPRAFDPGGSETPRSPQAKGPRQVPGSKRGG